jgi:DnaJ-class molecular chaperone
MSPVGWIEFDPKPGCAFCGRTRSAHDDTTCRFTNADEICDECDGAGILGDVRRSDFDGRRCNACGGQGYIESSSQAGDPA